MLVPVGNIGVVFLPQRFRFLEHTHIDCPFVDSDGDFDYPPIKCQIYTIHVK